MSPSNLNILFIGDIVGSLGRSVVSQLLPELKKKLQADITITNGENSAHGYGITEKIYNELMDMGIDAITMGNHMWDKKETGRDIDKFPNMVRPANYPKGVPGKDHLILETAGCKIGILNLLGRTFMQCMDCPFQAADKLIPKIREQTPIILVDMHAEATSEKCAMGYFLDGKASAVIGTHTHVMTADERILENGTAFIADAGMVGAQDSIIGMDRVQILKRFLTQTPEKFEPTNEGRGLFNAVLITIDKTTGKAKGIKRIIEFTNEIKAEKT